MIPAPIIAEARKAAADADPWVGDALKALDAYEAVLSRHWPAADGRGSEVLTEACAWRKRNPGAVAAFELAAAVDRYLAALSTPAPAENVRVVRVAVAGDHDGMQEAWLIDEDRTIQDVWDGAHAAGYPIRLCIAEIPVPIRDVPTVRASVEAPHD